MRGSTTAGDGLLATALRAFERRFLARALRRAHGHVGDAAAALGIHRRALERKMDAYDLRDAAAAARAEAGTHGPRDCGNGSAKSADR